MNTQPDPSNLFKQKRDEYLVDIRRKKNTDHIESRRLKLTLPADQAEETAPQLPQEKPNLSLNELAVVFVDLLKAENLAELPNVANQIRLLASIGNPPPIGELIATGILPHLVNLLSPRFFSETALLLECSWIVINIVANDEYQQVVEEFDLISVGYELLEHPDQEIKDNAIWILANIAGDNYEYRIKLLENGITKKIEVLFNDGNLRPSIHSSLAWLISNLCKKPYPDFGMIGELPYYIQTYLKDCKGRDVISYCLNALSSLTDTHDENQIREILDMEILGELAEILASSSVKNKRLVLRILGNIASCSENQLQVLIDNGFVEALFPLLRDEKKSLRKEACFVYSHLLDGSLEQINAIFAFNDGKILEMLYDLAIHDKPDVAEECVFALCHAVGGGCMQVRFLVDMGIIEMLVEILTKSESKDVLDVCLEALESILTDGKDLASMNNSQDNAYFVQFESVRGIFALEKLLQFPDQDVFAKAGKILSEFVENR